MHGRLFQSVVAWLLMQSASAVAANLPDATASYVRTVEGKPPTRGKLYVSKGRLRTESELPRGTIVLIVDPGSGQAWLVLPPPLGCVVQPIDDTMRASMPLFLSKDLKETLVATEIVDGHPTKKYELTSPSGPLTTRYVWRASDLRGFPIKTMDESGLSTTTFENVVIGKPDAKLFQAPAGCKRVSAADGSAAPK
jgi:hypothetical protein